LKRQANLPSDKFAIWTDNKDQPLDDCCRSQTAALKCVDPRKTEELN
jgi:hypothetical protein